MMRRREQLEWKRYRVCGSRTFQEHEPGTVFVARLRSDRETWALRHRYIELLEVVDMSLARVSRTLPADWDADIPADAGKRAAGERRLSTLEREEVTASGIH